LQIGEAVVMTRDTERVRTEPAQPAPVWGWAACIYYDAIVGGRAGDVGATTVRAGSQNKCLGPLGR